MLSQHELRAVIPNIDPGIAKTFFQHTLGLTLMSEDKFAMEFNANGTVLRVVTVGPYTSYPFTVLDWQVKDIKAEITALKEKSVVFEIFGFFEQDVYGIWTAPDGPQVPGSGILMETCSLFRKNQTDNVELIKTGCLSIGNRWFPAGVALSIQDVYHRYSLA